MPISQAKGGAAAYSAASGIYDRGADARARDMLAILRSVVYAKHIEPGLNPIRKCESLRKRYILKLSEQFAYRDHTGGII